MLYPLCFPWFCKYLWYCAVIISNNWNLTLHLTMGQNGTILVLPTFGHYGIMIEIYFVSQSLRHPQKMSHIGIFCQPKCKLRIWVFRCTSCIVIIWWKAQSCFVTYFSTFIARWEQGTTKFMHCSTHPINKYWQALKPYFPDFVVKNLIPAEIFFFSIDNILH